MRSKNCSVKKCRRVSKVTFIGRGEMCQKHFEIEYGKINEGALPYEVAHRKKVETNFRKRLKK